MTTKKSTQLAFPSMFSAASFFDVIDAQQQADTSSELLSEQRPPVVAFYGFKGGAGRTLALANVAALLARRGTGMHIATIDFDFEAPGLHLSLAADISGIESGQGLVPLLRSAVTSRDAAVLPVVDSLIRSSVSTGNGRIYVLPAGKVDRKYLAQIEELNVSLWHSFTPPQPVQRVLRDLTSQLQLDAIFLDCRTGFNGLSASLLFHVADAIVVFLPMSSQIWDGLDILLDALRAAQANRSGLPEILLVPSMVPAGEAGRHALRPFIDSLRGRLASKIDNSPSDSDDETVDEAPSSILEDGLFYDARVALIGKADRQIEAGYSALAESVADIMGLRFTPAPADGLDVTGILDEFHTIDSPFAEDASVETLVKHFVRPSDMTGILHPDTMLIVGAKGAGKTWMWRYLVHMAPPRADESSRFIAGHAPAVNESEAGPLQLTKSAIREIEKSAQMVRRATHQAFWRYYAIARLNSSVRADQLAAAVGRDRSEKKALTDLLKASSGKALSRAIEACLLLPKTSTLAEEAIQFMDSHMRAKDQSRILCFDGLDTDFEGRNLKESTARLLEVVMESRSKLRCVRFKVFVREDIWADISLQNRSHFATAMIELRWQPEDLWKIALDQLSESPKYLALIESIQPGISKPWPVNNDTLEALLTPFWGRTVEGRKGRGKARTARYVQKRILDAKGRVFPRTMLQVLSRAVIEQRKKPPTAGRVISFAALRAALENASVQRVDDLTKEYAHLRPYLEAMRGMNAISTRDEIVNSLRRQQIGRTKKGGGVGAGALHAGAGGWRKVVRQLEEVGVLGPYERDRDSDRLAVAMLYRSGLQVRAVGGLH